MNEIECEWDGCEETFGTVGGMKQHHLMVHGVSIAGEPVDCDYCGEEYREKPAMLERSEYNYCSKECHDNHQSIRQSEKVEVECDTCGKSIKRLPSDIDDHDRLFCSRECQGEWLSDYYQENEFAPGYEREAKPWHDKETLKELYHDKDMDIGEIGDHFGISKFTISHWISRLGIPVKNPNAFQRVERCAFYTGKRGYESVISHPDELRIHTLVAIANGADPCDLFNDDYVVHHKNEIPWDNRPENLEVMDRGEHSTHHLLKNNPRSKS